MLDSGDWVEETFQLKLDYMLALSGILRDNAQNLFMA